MSRSCPVRSQSTLDHHAHVHDDDERASPRKTRPDDIAANRAPSIRRRPSTCSRAYVEKLPIGSIVKVKMKEGKDVKGTLMVIEPDAIVVKPKTRLARPERRLPLHRGRVRGAADSATAPTSPNPSRSAWAPAPARFFGLMLLAFVIIDD